MMAFDHRNSFERDLDRIGALSNSARRAELKLMIWESVRETLPRLPTEASAAVLVDHSHDRVVSEAVAAGVTIAIALEASGQRALIPDATPAVLSRDLRATNGGLGKVLIRWFPDDAASERQQRLAELRQLDQLVSDAGSDLLLELLVPPADGEALNPSARQRWEETVLPIRQREAVDEILNYGLAPAVWKIEGHPDSDAATDLSNLVGSARPDASILVLGGGAKIGDLRRIFSGGAHIGRFAGFAVGRSIWWQPVAALCLEQVDESSARRAISDNFLAVLDIFNSATHATSQTKQYTSQTKQYG